MSEDGEKKELPEQLTKLVNGDGQENTPALEDQEAADKMAAFQLAQNKILGQLTGIGADVAIAACVASAATIAVDAGTSLEGAKGYLQRCFFDVVPQMDKAWENKHSFPGEPTDGDTGDKGKEPH